MIYQIDVNQGKNKQFLQMVELMTDLGVIESIHSKNNIALPNNTLTDDELLKVISESKEQIENDNFYTMEEMKQRIESWKHK